MRTVLHGTMYNGIRLSQSKKNYQGFYVEILQVIELLLQNMIRRHSEVFFIRFDLRYPAGSSLIYPNNNDLVKKFSEALVLHCKRKKYDPKYLWVRELSEKSGQFHYHFILLLNADHIQNAYELILDYATKLWQRCLGIEDGKGLVQLTESTENNYYYDDSYGGVKIRRYDKSFQRVYAKCFEIASYLAKRFSKGSSPCYVNEIGHSKMLGINQLMKRASAGKFIF